MSFLTSFCSLQVEREEKRNRAKGIDRDGRGKKKKRHTQKKITQRLFLPPPKKQTRQRSPGPPCGLPQPDPHGRARRRSCRILLEVWWRRRGRRRRPRRRARRRGGGTPAPVRLLGGASFLHLRAGDVHVLAVTRDNVNAMLAFSFMVKVREEKKSRRKQSKEKTTSDQKKLDKKTSKKKTFPKKKKVVGLMRTYFGGEFSEAAIRSNFVLVYELLDEVADHGWPQVRKKREFRSSCFSLPLGVLEAENVLIVEGKKPHSFLPSLLFLSPTTTTTTGHRRQRTQGPRLPKGLHHLRRARQEGGGRGRRDAPGHGGGGLEARRPEVQAQRGVFGRHREGLGAGRRRRDRAEGRREGNCWGWFFFGEEEEERGAFEEKKGKKKLTFERTKFPTTKKNQNR